MEIRLKTKTNERLYKPPIELIKSVPVFRFFEFGKTKILRNYVEFDYELNTEVPMTEIRNVLIFRCLKDIHFDTVFDGRSIFTWGIATPESEEEKEILNECNDNGKKFKSFFLPGEVELKKGDTLILPKGEWFYFHTDNYVQKMEGTYKGTYTLP